MYEDCEEESDGIVSASYHRFEYLKRKSGEPIDLNEYKTWLIEQKKIADEKQKRADEIARIEHEVWGNKPKVSGFLDRKGSFQDATANLDPKAAHYYGEKLDGIANTINSFVQELTLDKRIPLALLYPFLSAIDNMSNDAYTKAAILLRVGEDKNETDSNE